MTISLHIEERGQKGKNLTKLRAEGKLPAVVYGPKEPSLPIALDQKEFDKVLKEAGESSIIVLEGVGDNKEVLIHDVDFNALKGGIQHVDFYAIERGKELTTNVALEFVGEAPAAKQGGSLTKALHEVEVTCRPSALPKSIVVDVSSLNTLEDSIRVEDLQLPDGVKIENDGNETVAVVIAAREEEEEPVEAVDMDSVEVEKKGSEESEKTEE